MSTLIRNSKDLKKALRAGPYAWPGGYPVYFITTDGAVLSFQSVREQFRSVLWSVRNFPLESNRREHDGFRVIAADVNWEDPDLYCDHSARRIESAYAEDTSTRYLRDAKIR